MIGKLVASQSKATFFSITASALTSKWIGEGIFPIYMALLIDEISCFSFLFALRRKNG